MGLDCMEARGVENHPLRAHPPPSPRNRACGRQAMVRGIVRLGNVEPMPDQSAASSEHALIREVTEPLSRLPEDPLAPVADVDFPVVLRGYDRLAVDAYVKRTSQLVAELQATRSPESAVRRALERVGEEVSGILQRAHETAEQITAASRREAEDRLELARHEAEQILAGGERKLSELDAETDRIWAERHQIVEDARLLASRLLELAEEAAERFPAADDLDDAAAAELPSEAGSALEKQAEHDSDPPPVSVAPPDREHEGDEGPDADATAVMRPLDG